MGSRLTDKQERFCLEYVRTGVASEAYRLIYSAGRMSDKQVWEESSKLMANPKVAQRVAEIREEVTAPARKSLSIDKKWVLEQLVENVSTKISTITRTSPPPTSAPASSCAMSSPPCNKPL